MATDAGQSADEDLVARYRAGDGRALQRLLERYRRLATIKARSYFLVGGDLDDVQQEAMIGLYKAVRDFRPERQSSFRAFAELCVTRNVHTAIKMASRQKHMPLNGYVSISSISERLGDELLEAHHERDLADVIVAGEQFREIGRSLSEALSTLEADVLRLYVEGQTYQEIGERLGRHAKAIDNALQRVKRKVGSHLQARAAAELEAVA